MADIKGTLSICRRAGKLIGGADEVKAACRRKEARLVIAASDISGKSLKEIKFICDREKAPLAVAPETADDFGACIGKRWAVVAITDPGFAKAILKKLSSD